MYMTYITYSHNEPEKCIYNAIHYTIYDTLFIYLIYMLMTLCAKLK